MKKVAVITNASYGIGYKIALAVAGKNFDLVLTDRDSKENLKEIVSLCKEKGSAFCYPFAGNLSDPVIAKRLYNEIAVIIGGSDTLINIADTEFFGKTRDIKDEDYMSAINENLSAAFYCIRNAIPYMNKVKTGNIINICGSQKKNNCGSGEDIISESQENNNCTKQEKFRASSVEAAFSGIRGLTEALAKELPEVSVKYFDLDSESEDSIIEQIGMILK